jgi:hypothetical protein
MRGITAALARKLMGFLNVMSLLWSGCIDLRSEQPRSNPQTRSPQPQKLVVPPTCAGVADSAHVRPLWSVRHDR